MCSITRSYLNSNTCFSNQWSTHPCNGHVHSLWPINWQTKCFTFASYKHMNKVLHISFLQIHQQSVSHFLLTETHTQQPKKVTCAIMAKVKSHLVTLDWQIKKSFPKKNLNCDFSGQKRSHVQSSQKLQH